MKRIMSKRKRRVRNNFERFQQISTIFNQEWWAEIQCKEDGLISYKLGKIFSTLHASINVINTLFFEGTGAQRGRES